MPELLPADMPLSKNVNWDRIARAKQAAKDKIDQKERERAEAEHREHTMATITSQTRYCNFIVLMRDVIGDLIDEFEIVTDGPRETMLGDNGLCTATRTTFRLVLPHHNPIHVFVQYGGIKPQVLNNETGEIEQRWVSADVPTLVETERKFTIFPDPEFHRKVAGKVKLIRRVAQSQPGVPINVLRSVGFDDIGEALVAAEEMWMEFHDPSSESRKYLDKIAELQSEEEKKIVAPLLKEEASVHPGVVALKTQLESLFTLSRKNNVAQEVGNTNVENSSNQV